MPRGSLFRLLHRAKPEIDGKRRLQMAMDIARGALRRAWPALSLQAPM
jgi:hypothetical protein